MLLKSIRRANINKLVSTRHSLFKSLKMSTETALPDGHVEIIEGTAKMIYDQKEAVFYNKVQVLNRDLSIQVIRLFSETIGRERKAKHDVKVAKFVENNSPVGREPWPLVEGITVLDALAATGLRSIRYAKEIPLLREIVINDLLEDATKAALENCKFNNVDQTKVKVHNRDATLLMYEHREPNLQFDVVDLDPYGSACPFLDSAVQAVTGDGGLLIVTCTDTAILAGNYSEVCFSKYGSVSLKAGFMHEMSLRILLNAIEASATKYKRHIVPWISLSVDFYIRVFVRVYESAAEAKNSCLRRGMVYQSTQCPSYYVQPLAESKKNSYSAAPLAVPSVCPETGGNMKIGGPFWIEPIHHQEVVDELLRRVESGIVDEDAEEPVEVDKELLPFPVSTARRLTGILSSMSDELKDVPFYYTLDNLAHAVECIQPTHLSFKSALLNAGYRVSHFHHEPLAMKTDAPPNVVWDIMRAHCKLFPPIGSKNKKTSPSALKILNKESTTVVDFTTHPSLVGGGKRGIARFPPNPEANWGPKRRAGRPAGKSEELVQKERDEKNAKKQAYKAEMRALHRPKPTGEEPAEKRTKV